MYFAVVFVRVLYGYLNRRVCKQDLIKIEYYLNRMNRKPIQLLLRSDHSHMLTTTVYKTLRTDSWKDVNLSHNTG